jgi:DNA-binding response OmpR family regulator
LNDTFKFNNNININIIHEGEKMEPLILIVEDDPNILKYLKMTLEFNKYRIMTANNGKHGLKVLSESNYTPDLIVSDIMMPEMDGYEFFNKVSNNPSYYHVPFIFLSALDSPEDVRLGKMLGVDDYLTKPIKEEDLLAIVAGKIRRSKTSIFINNKINEMFASYQIEEESFLDENSDQIILIQVEFDDIVGPKIVNNFPKDIKLEFSLKKIGEELYDGVLAMYGQDSIFEADGFLVPKKNINIMAYIFFDSCLDSSYRGGRKQYMFSLLATKITYLQSLKLKQVFMEFSSLYKNQEKWEIEEFWNKASNVLTKTSLITSSN